MNKFGPFVGLLALFAVCFLWEASAQAQNISMTSPFLPRTGSPIGATTENSPVELRGILRADGSPVFGLYDPVKRQSGWVKLNETGKDFPATVRSYDAANEAISVEYQGRTVNLALKTAKIESLPMTTPGPRPAQPPVPGVSVTGGPQVDNARQMEAVAAEVQRRRLQRQAALQQNQASPNGPGQPGVINAPVPPQPYPGPRTNTPGGR
jgi:hypothetical protein